MIYYSTMLVLSIVFYIIFLYFTYLNVFIVVRVIYFSVSSVDIGLFLLFDSVRCIFIFVVFLIRGLVLKYSIGYMDHDKYKDIFMVLVVIFVISICLIVLGVNIFSILIGWDGLGLISYLLVIYYNNESSSSAGILTILINRLGDVGLIFSIIVLLGTFGLLDIIDVRGVRISVRYLIVLIVILGAMTKRAQVPFSSWLPAAIAAPTPVSSLVHSSTLVTAGVYLLVRVESLTCFSGLRSLLFVISVITVFISGFGAFYEVDLKKIIAYSTLSQLGIIMIMVSLGCVNLALFHLFIHAMYKAILFLCAGIIFHSFVGVQDIRYLSCLWKVSPGVSIVICAGLMSLSGVPFISGFYSKDLIFEKVFRMNGRYLILMIVFVGIFIRVIYSLRLLYLLLVRVNFLSLNSELIRGWANFSILLLGCISVTLGCLTRWLMFSTPIVLYLGVWVKVLCLLVLFLGVLLYFVMNSIKNTNLFNCKVIIFIYHIMGDMIFLSSLSRDLVFSKFSVNKKYVLYDVCWLEDVQAVGLRTEVDSIMTILLNYNMAGLSKNLAYVLLFIVMVVVCI